MTWQEIITTASGVSGVFGFLGVTAALVFRSIEQSKSSVIEEIAGEYQVPSKDIAIILETFTDDQNRLKALELLLRVPQDRAKDVLGKLRSAAPSIQRKYRHRFQLLLIIGGVGLLFAMIGFAISMTPTLSGPMPGPTPPDPKRVVIDGWDDVTIRRGPSGEMTIELRSGPSVQSVPLRTELVNSVVEAVKERITNGSFPADGPRDFEKAVLRMLATGVLPNGDVAPPAHWFTDPSERWNTFVVLPVNPSGETRITNNIDTEPFAENGRSIRVHLLHADEDSRRAFRFHIKSDIPFSQDGDRQVYTNTDPGDGDLVDVQQRQPGDRGYYLAWRGLGMSRDEFSRRNPNAAILIELDTLSKSMLFPLCPLDLQLTMGPLSPRQVSDPVKFNSLIGTTIVWEAEVSEFQGGTYFHVASDDTVVWLEFDDPSAEDRARQLAEKSSIVIRGVLQQDHGTALGIGKAEIFMRR